MKRKNSYKFFLKTALMLVLFSLLSCNLKQDETLKVSNNGHYLVNADGTPFYWIGDTGWAMFQQLTREEVDQYLDNRKAKGFTVIQSVAFWYPHGAIEALGPLNETNAYGHRPFVGEPDAPNTSKPLIKEGGSATAPNDYWDHADYVVQAVQERGLKLCLLPCWANAHINNRMKGSRIIFTGEEAKAYGKFIAKRYKNEKHIIWCLGGDVDPVLFGDKDQRSVYRAMAEGIGWGTSGNPNLKWNEAHADWDKSFITFHAVQAPYLSGEGKEGGSSSLWFHNDAWLDFNMMETFKWMHQVHGSVSIDYNKKPTKPTLLGEGAYEIGQYGNECGYITPLKVRRQGYHAFFAGSLGYTYGHWSIWPFREEYCGFTWEEALNAPGAIQIAEVMQNFVRERDIFAFVPDQKIIHSDKGEGETLKCAMLKEDKSEMLIYLPELGEVKIDMEKLDIIGDVSINWFDPRNGNVLEAKKSTDSRFVSPENWEDAILIVN